MLAVEKVWSVTVLCGLTSIALIDIDTATGNVCSLTADVNNLEAPFWILLVIALLVIYAMVLVALRYPTLLTKSRRKRVSAGLCRRL